MAMQQIISPIDGSLVAERATIAPGQLEAALDRASAAQREWGGVALAERVAICERMVQHMLDKADDIAAELTRQMGRPIRYTPVELKRCFQERARHMSAIAPEALADIAVEPKQGFTRFIRKDPVGTVLVVAPWNYPYLTSVSSIVPALLAGVNHAMRVMKEESFGPVIGIMPVRDDAEAIRLMNDSPYGLTASIWTNDTDAAIRIGDQIATGTWYMNRCNYLDPALAWIGVKNTGRGCTLSVLGFDAFTQPKSFHLKHVG